MLNKWQQETRLRDGSTFKNPLTKFQENFVTEIGLLIGANSAKALEPQEVIPSKDGGPFAFRSLCVSVL